MKFNSIIKEGLCIGCGLCEALGNKMVITEKGFFEPSDSSFSNYKNQKIIEKVCPGSETFHKNSSTLSHPIWGSFKDIVKTHSLNKDIRFGASSGGVITSLLKYLVEQKIVDFVIITTADEKNPIINQSYLTNNIKKIINSQSSRYSPSSPLKEIFKAKENKQRIALVGKPCDITAYKNLEKLIPELKNTVVYTISFLCAGIPSIKGTKKIIENFNIDLSRVKSIKYRGNGCPGNFTIKTNNNASHTLSYNDSWGKVLNKYLHKRCKICPDGTGESADISCGDIWKEEDGKPVFINNDGDSLVIVRKSNGEKLISKLVFDNIIAKPEQITIDYLNRVQPYQVVRRKYLLARYLGLLLSFKKTPNYDFARFGKFIVISPILFFAILLKTFIKSVKSEL
jgi:coenzyme F420 hydrogenase subunit beta